MPDKLTSLQRSYCMSRVRRENTDLERIISSELRKKKMSFTKHSKTLPGTPDIVFFKTRVAVFVDGDFWHGYRLPNWEDKIQDFWRVKIGKNRARDRKNFRKLRKMGWTVLRIWQHEIKKDIKKSIARIVSAVESKRQMGQEKD